ncbi:protein GRINL1A [Synchiropus splendidus]|uniref:protein GRINL1A n=1 Tax=Synchiropus splendidus TaxID=270530 RepID=UPI00237EE859|nr:protein GRINL1A [Synchiropus splendidus]
MVDRGSWADRQGQVGDLRGQSKQQLRELLRRQEKILSNKQLLKTLPDQGKRIQEFSIRLQQAIDLHEEEERKQNLLSEAGEELRSKYRQAFIAQQRNPPRLTAGNTEETSPANAQQTVDSNGPLADETMESSSVGTPVCELTERFDKVKLNDHERSAASELNKHAAGDNSFLKREALKKPHYISVLERTEKTTGSGKPKFKPNQFPQQSENSSGSSSPLHASEGSSPLSAEARREQDRKHLDDITAAKLPPLHHSPAQLLSLEESALLLKEQTKKQQELQAKLAAQKLSEGLKAPMTSYTPDGPSDAYREVHDEGAQLSSEED